MADKKFYQNKKFKALNNEWRKKLEASGFSDIEDELGNLKVKETRSRAVDGCGRSYSKNLIHVSKSSRESQGATRDFFYKLDHYLNSNPDINSVHRTILELYSAGTNVKGKDSIVEKTGLSDRGIRYIISRYKALIQK